MKTSEDIYDMTDGLCDTFEDYALQEEKDGQYFAADVWRKASDITRSYVGRWNVPRKETTNAVIMTWKEIDVSDF